MDGGVGQPDMLLGVHSCVRARVCVCVCVKAWWGMLLWTSNAVAASESESAIAIVHICCICVCTHAGDSLSESGTIHNMECLYEIYLQFL